MKLIDSINALFKSKDLNDIIIGIVLAYELSFEEFDAIFSHQVPTGILPEDDAYYFIRNNRIYFMGSAYLGRSMQDHETFENFKENNFDFSNYIDLTP